MSAKLCQACNGTGADHAKTANARKAGQCDTRSYVRCWACNGNGLDPSEYFKWSEPRKEEFKSITAKDIKAYERGQRLLMERANARPILNPNGPTAFPG